MVASQMELQIKRVIPASRERVFTAWTDPEELKQWWGPVGVNCRSASIDLQVGGRYKIENELPDGSILWISGEFEIIEAPKKLVFTWATDATTSIAEKVTVLLKTHVDGTEVTIVHQRIATADLRDQHELGWNGCIDGLTAHIV